MTFQDTLNDYIETLSCTAKDLSERSGLSAATLSRYRSGERVPEPDSDAFSGLCNAIAELAAAQHLSDITAASVRASFLECSDLSVIDKEQFRQNFQTLVTVLNLNMTRLSQSTNYDTSTISRFRNGSRQLSDPESFARSVANFVSAEVPGTDHAEVLAKLLDCSASDLTDSALCAEKVHNWLLHNTTAGDDSIFHFLTKLDEFDLNEYMKAIHFDKLKVPPAMPFQFPTSKSYFGISEMMESELDFLKATVLSKSMADVTEYSDMPMGEIAKDPDFPKKWMFGMAMMLKKGLHLNHIHNLERSFEDMMLGLEAWIPMYMTGQVSPYYLKEIPNNTFLHFLKVSGTVALTGEAIREHQNDGRYYLTKSKDEVAYYQKRAQDLLSRAYPLMNIYREDNAGALSAFLLADAKASGDRRLILSALPLYTMTPDFLKAFLAKRSLAPELQQQILAFAENRRQMVEQLLSQGTLTLELAPMSKEEFETYPTALCLSELFLESDVSYTWEEYQTHLEQTRQYAKEHPGCTVVESSAHAFRNLQIRIHNGKWAMVSKNKAPAIHFVIHHPRLLEAIEQFVPPVL